MFPAFCKVLDREDSYTFSQFVTDFIERCRFGVVDADSRDDRCCALTTVNPTTTDIFDCGHVDEAQMQEPELRDLRQNQRYVKRLMIVGLVVWATIGIMAVINPEAIMFNTVIDDEYKDYLSEGKHMKNEVVEHQKRLDDQKKEIERGANAVVSYLNEMLRSEKADEKDRTAVMHVLELASAKMATAKCETVVITSPIRMYGAVCLFYAIVCMTLLSEPVAMKTSVTSTHLAWYICGLIGSAIATTGHGRNMESSTLTFALIGFNALMAVAWFLVREFIMRYLSMYTLKQTP